MQAYGGHTEGESKKRYTLEDDYGTTSPDMSVMSAKGLNITAFGLGKKAKGTSTKASGIEDQRLDTQEDDEFDL